MSAAATSRRTAPGQRAAGAEGTTRPWLFLRSLFWTIAFPGFFAGYLPWRLWLRDAQIDRVGALEILGLVCIVVGAALLTTCIFEFARSGRGTLSPVDPPSRLVVQGLYRYVRNPMYLSVITLVAGEALLARSAALGLYGAIWFLCAGLFVIGFEEPALRRRFGASYDQYTRQVGRWIPRRPRRR